MLHIVKLRILNNMIMLHIKQQIFKFLQRQMSNS
jgi:hypothetical protein